MDLPSQLIIEGKSNTLTSFAVGQTTAEGMNLYDTNKITCAKGLTSGYLRLGAMIFSDSIWRVITKGDHGRCLTQGYTYSGSPPPEPGLEPDGDRRRAE